MNAADVIGMFIEGCESPGFEAKLACPICGFDYVHVESVHVLQGKISAMIEHEAVHSRSHDTPTDRRGSVIGIDCNCEYGCMFRIRFQFHKGQTFVSVDYRKHEPNKDSELWRD